MRLSAQGVSVTSGAVVRLAEVDLTVESGQVHALVGPNGSGKSTLLAVLAGELRPSHGTVLVDGKPWAQVSARAAARQRALLAQETSLAFPFTTRDVIGWGRLPWRGTPEQDRDDEVIEAIVHEHDLTDLLDRPVPSLSGGERARVHLARVLAQRAPILLLDEADAALDLIGQAHLDDAVRRRRAAGDAIVIVGHDLGRLAALADTATLLSHGRPFAQGPVERTLTPAALSAAYGVPVAVARAEGRPVFWADTHDA